MGVDKKNVRTVIHRDVRSTAESFIQESGRGARDGGIAESFLLWNYADYEKFSSFPYGSRERDLLQFAQASDCRRQVLLDALGAEQAACAGCDICRAKSCDKCLYQNISSPHYIVNISESNHENSVENIDIPASPSKRNNYNLN